MKYRNASEILPDELLKELQKYAQGEILYVPSGKGRKKWGEDTGAQSFYEQRNEEIRYKYFRVKTPIYALCDEYGLSDETVRKILYR
ncbi:MAG: CD3324 family protein [Defluviitaleaceae bacterium]|nr:CD3324 family protein [Defluviitaleaceae bacterium]